MKDKFEKVSDYFYKDSYVLKNSLGIKDEEQLNIMERKLSSLRLAEFMDKPIKGRFDFKQLKDIHRYLFQDLYPWAGELRKCEINKVSLFCLFDLIEENAAVIFDGIFNDNYFIDYDDETKIAKLVELFGNINVLHPFREGNGRTQRIFIEALAKVNGLDIDLTKITQSEMIQASIKDACGDSSLLLEHFTNNCRKLNKEEQMYYICKYCEPRLAKYLMTRVMEKQKNRR